MSDDGSCQPRADFHQKRTLATFGRQGLIVVYALTRSVETSQPIFITLPTAQYTYFYGHLLR